MSVVMTNIEQNVKSAGIKVGMRDQRKKIMLQ